jgi:signal transduction histidine kinase
MSLGRLDSTRRELLLAAGVTVAVELAIILSGHTRVAGQAVAALLVTLPLALRLRHPVEVLAVVVAGTVIVVALGGRLDSSLLVVPVALALYAAGSRTSGVRLWISAGVSLVGLLATMLISRPDLFTTLAVPLLVTACGLVVGRALGVLRFEWDEFDKRASELEREREERARLAVADERRRIARELHDVIGHSISVMGVQAGAVRTVLREDQRREREALLAVERTARQTVGEMRRLIGLLRTDEDGAAASAPSLLRVEQLAKEMRDAGLGVHLCVRGDLQALSPGVDLAGFRILQEALTNALKHAPAAGVHASVSCDKRTLTIEVIDDGAGAVQPSAGHVGHGLLGMRERAALYRGELIAGPRPGGGFAVYARLPLEAL